MVSDKFIDMWKPIKIGSIRIKNRFLMAPIDNGFVEHGAITEQYIAYFAARARGGVGVIVTGPPAAAYPDGQKTYGKTPNLHDGFDLKGWNDLAETVHAFDSKLFIQVGPKGCRGRSDPGGVAPSVVPLRIPLDSLPKKEEAYRIRKGLKGSSWDRFLKGAPPRALTIEEIHKLEEIWANQCLLAKQTGADGVELHFAHGYLAHNFLSPHENLRTDEYGGSFDNRLRFCRNIVTKARALCGPDFPIGARMVGTDRVAGGLGVKDMIKIIRRLEECGLDFIDMSDGCYEAAKYSFPEEDGTMIPIAAELKRELKLPIMCANIHKPQLGEQALRDGKIDMIALGRSLIVDAEYVNKCAEQGTKVKLTKCIRCLICRRRIRWSLPMRCEVNREVGLEQYDPRNWRINAPKKKEFWYPTD